MRFAVIVSGSGVAEGVGVMVAFAVSLRVAFAVGVGEMVALGVGVSAGVGDGVSVAFAVGVGEIVAVGVGVSAVEGVAVGVEEGVAVAETCWYETPSVTESTETVEVPEEVEKVILALTCCGVEERTEEMSQSAEVCDDEMGIDEQEGAGT